VVLYATAAAHGQDSGTGTASGTAKPAAVKPAAGSTKAARSPRGSFDTLSKQANAAREAARLDEAIGLYQKALALNRSWTDGWWYLGLSAYELDRYQVARDAFRRVVDLMPQNGDAWAFKGLCEYRLKHYDVALSDLMRGRSLGGGSALKDLVTTSRYHMGILLTRNEQYEQAMQMLNGFAVEGDDSPKVIEAMGLATLRIPMLPEELPGVRREQVMLAGRAAYFQAARLPTAAQKAYEELVNRYPELPNVHYAYGVFLVGEQPDAAIEQFKTELEVSPRHPWAKLQLAFEYLRRSDWEAARPWAEQAVDEAPDLFVAHRALGQVLLETGDVAGAIRELEAGVKQAPDSPAMRFALARAYRRAGRVDDAEREQAEFTRLNRILRTQRTGAQSVGGIDVDTTGDAGAQPAPAAPSPQ
jgi:tetratricopeptide (TPR) repeat protein